MTENVIALRDRVTVARSGEYMCAELRHDDQVFTLTQHLPLLASAHLGPAPMGQTIKTVSGILAAQLAADVWHKLWSGEVSPEPETETVVDQFAGAGGWDVAARWLGMDPLGIENDGHACATRDAAGLRTLEADIREVNPIPAIGLITSPPCPTFSAAGRGSGRRNLDQLLELVWKLVGGGDWRALAKDVIEDERTALVLEPLHWIVEMHRAGMPYRWVAMEQVPPVLPVWEQYAVIMREMGYSAATGNVHAEQYGVPQTRKRAVLLASLDREMTLPAPTHSKYHPRDSQRVDDGVRRWVSMAEAIGWGFIHRPAMSIVSASGAGGRRGGDGGSRAWGNVLNAREQGFWTRAPHRASHPFNRGEVSTMPIPDIAMLQSFPGDYPWRGGETVQALQIGNAVPPLLAYHLLASVTGMTATDERTRIVMFSGGVTSWAAAVRCIERFGKDKVVLAFADTMTENADLYAFIDKAAEHLGVPLHTIRDGRNVWEVFKDARYLGNSRIDPCSRVLKRDSLRTWLHDNFTPETAVVVLGMDWTEGNRIAKTAKYWDPWTVEFPLNEPPYVDKAEWLRLADEAGLPRNELYEAGMPHANCGGFCVKAGQGQFAMLLEHFPDRYAYHEQQEQNLRAHLGKDVSIMRDRRGGTVKPLTMKTFRERVQGAETDPSCDVPYDPLDIGGCGCMTPEDEGTDEQPVVASVADLMTGISHDNPEDKPVAQTKWLTPKRSKDAKRHGESHGHKFGRLSVKDDAATAKCKNDGCAVTLYVTENHHELVPDDNGVISCGEGKSEPVPEQPESHTVVDTTKAPTVDDLLMRDGEVENLRSTGSAQNPDLIPVPQATANDVLFGIGNDEGIFVTDHPGGSAGPPGSQALAEQKVAYGYSPEPSPFALELPPAPQTSREITLANGETWLPERDLIDTISDAIINHPRSQQQLIGPSEIGTKCDRCLGKKLMGVPQTRDVAWLPQVGTAVHDWLDTILSECESCGWITERKVTVGIIGNRVIRGRCDAYKNGVVVDFKGLALDTPIPTPTGWSTMTALREGDQVLDAWGEPCNVVAKSPIFERDCYRVEIEGAPPIIADNVHEWMTLSGHRFEPAVLSTEQMSERDLRRPAERVRVVNAAPLDLPEVDLPIPPYTLGAWLGDGHSWSGCIGKPDDELFEHIRTDGFDISSRIGKQAMTRNVYGLARLLRLAGLIQNKSVPEIYLRGSVSQRLDLLRGLMDTDGFWNRTRNQAVFCNTDKALAVAVYELAASLGWKPAMFTAQRTGFGVTATSYDVAFTPFDMNPFKLSRKADLVRMEGAVRSRYRFVKSVTKTITVPTQCIEVDSDDHSFLCGEAMTPTHNCVGANTLKTVAASGPTPVYRVQDHLYGRGYELDGYEVTHVALLYLPRNSPTLADAKLHIEPYDRSIALAALDRAQRIQEFVEADKANVLQLDRDPDCYDCSRFAPLPGEDAPGAGPRAGNPFAGIL